MALNIKAALAEKKNEPPTNLYSDFAGMFGLNESTQAVEYIPIQNTITYSKHPFKVSNDERLHLLASDIRERGVMNPIIVRKLGFDERYEILSGHRRTEASKISGLSEIKAIVVKVTDEQAAQIVVMTNFLQRETILPSERAKSYMLRNEYLKKLRKCSNEADERDFSHGGKKEADTYEILSAEFGESKSNIFRYIRLNFLVDELLDLVDIRKIRLVVAVDLSYIKPEHQRIVYQHFYAERPCKLEQSVVKQIAALSDADKLDEHALNNIIAMDTASKTVNKGFSLKPSVMNKYRRYFNSDKELNDAVMRFLDDYVKNKSS